MIGQHEATLKRTARRYSLNSDDAEDAYQRALEIVLTKAPMTDPHDLIRWTQTVTKHEALAVRRQRERLLSRPPGRDRDGAPLDPVALIPAAAAGPAEQAERREAVARTREALQALKPAELRALTLLAEGYSYAEIGQITGFSQTKINRCLAEGRERFRALVSSSEDGSRCRELRPLLSAFADGEAKPAQEASVREHLRACSHCRATMRTYRATPRLAAALVPALPASRSLFGKAHDLLGGLGTRLAGIGGGEPAAQIAAAGGSRGAGMLGLAKLLTLCAGAAGGAAACVAAGVLPAPLEIAADHARAPKVERAATSGAKPRRREAVQYETAPPPQLAAPPSHPAPHHPAPSPPEASSAEPEYPSGAVEYEAAAAPASIPSSSGSSTGSEGSSSGGGSAAGEFGP